MDKLRGMHHKDRLRLSWKIAWQVSQQLKDQKLNSNPLLKTIQKTVEQIFEYKSETVEKYLRELEEAKKIKVLPDGRVKIVPFMENQ